VFAQAESYRKCPVRTLKVLEKDQVRRKVDRSTVKSVGLIPSFYLKIIPHFPYREGVPRHGRVHGVIIINAKFQMVNFGSKMDLVK